MSPRAAGLIGVGVLLLALIGEPARELLRWDRTGILSGELWRLVTGHFVHLDFPHALWNLAGALLVYHVFASTWSRGEWLIVLLVAVIGIDTGLWWRSPPLDWYVGLSGVLHALAAAGLVPALLARPDGRAEPVAWVVAILGTVKLLYEQYAGALPIVDARVITTVHLDGVASGLLCGIVLYSIRRSKLARA